MLAATKCLVAITVASIGLGLVACDNPKSEVGLSLDEEGELVILYDPCGADSKAQSVQLENSDGRVLWRIDATDHPTTREFVAGREPDGFSTSVPLTTDLHGMRLRVEVSGIGPEYFELSQLDSRRVFVIGHGLMTREEFFAREKCESGWFT